MQKKKKPLEKVCLICAKGNLVSRGRMMTDDFKLNNRAKHWIKAIRAQYTSEMVEDKKKPKLSGTLTK